MSGYACRWLDDYENGTWQVDGYNVFADAFNPSVTTRQKKRHVRAE